MCDRQQPSIATSLIGAHNSNTFGFISHIHEVAMLCCNPAVAYTHADVQTCRCAFSGLHITLRRQLRNKGPMQHNLLQNVLMLWCAKMICFPSCCKQLSVDAAFFMVPSSFLLHWRLLRGPSSLLLQWFSLLEMQRNFIQCRMLLPLGFFIIIIISDMHTRHQ